MASDDGGRGFHLPKLQFFLLAAFELENRSPLPTPLDATAIAAGTGNRWNALTWFNLESFRSRGIRRARRFPWPALRLSLRPGARKLASSLLPSLATARIRPWPGPVIAPDVHDPACLRQTRSIFRSRGSSVLVLQTESPVGTITQCSAASDSFRFGHV